MNKTIDLHVHSTASDGTFTPSELVAEAKRCGLSAFALTDHDTVDGVSEALTAGKASGLDVIPGVELSTEYNGTEIHVVGLFIDPENTELQAGLAKFRDNRDNRNLKMVEQLQEEGFQITAEDHGLFTVERCQIIADGGLPLQPVVQPLQTVLRVGRIAGENEAVGIFQCDEPSLMVQRFNADPVADGQRRVLRVDCRAGVALFLGGVPEALVAGEFQSNLFGLRLCFL